MHRAAAALIILFLAGAPVNASAVHDEPGKLHCLDCHRSLPFLGRVRVVSFRDGTEGVCMNCHIKYHGGASGFSHPVRVLPSMKTPPDFPLDAKGRITCITCHTFHQRYKDENGKKTYFLRRTRGKFLCYSCHPKRLAASE